MFEMLPLQKIFKKIYYKYESSFSAETGEGIINSRDCQFSIWSHRGKLPSEPQSVTWLLAWAFTSILALLLPLHFSYNEKRLSPGILMGHNFQQCNQTTKHNEHCGPNSLLLVDFFYINNSHAAVDSRTRDDGILISLQYTAFLIMYWSLICL